MNRRLCSEEGGKRDRLIDLYRAAVDDARRDHRGALAIVQFRSQLDHLAARAAKLIEQLIYAPRVRGDAGEAVDVDRRAVVVGGGVTSQDLTGRRV